jgi:hypothetical protein
VGTRRFIQFAEGRDFDRFGWTYHPNLSKSDKLYAEIFMASELETALKNAAASVAQYVKDIATMTVETQYVEVGPDGAVDFSQAHPVARTVIKLDGDSQSVVPVRRNEAGVQEVDSGLFELHQQNVTTTIEYRARMLNALLSTLGVRR